ncbi:MFS family permease [Methanomicrobium sp. W14]|uniref:MFS transporter n=1 Tax=Methanomicrobium sp. W14 TaxID=2817839 RepID=UPI001AE710E2|nr:MFS transporter [Methanomicrobium sp. W14]MBP2134221.1 MFS family permease [Methanomicrobium sp. W14]
MDKSQAFNPDSPVVVITIMSIFFLMMGLGVITPALNVIMDAFPDLSISTFLLISNLPSLLMIPGSVIAGVIAGSKMKYRTLAALGILLFIIGGIAPVFLDNFYVILINRAVFGFGLGLISPLGSALILNFYEGDMQAKLLGVGTIVMNVGGIILQFFGGFFASFGWHASFWAHAFAIASFVLVLLFLPEPQKKSVSETGSSESQDKVKVPAGVWMISIAFGIALLLLYPVLLNMSSFMTENSLGDSTVAGIVLSFYTIGGMIAGALFGSLSTRSITRRYIISIALFCMAAGLGLVFYGGNVVIVALGIAVTGAGFSIMYPGVLMIIGVMANPEVVAKSTSIMTVCMGVFAFLSGYWIDFIGNITGDAIAMPLFAGMVLLGVGAFASVFVNPFPKEKSKS